MHRYQATSVRRVATGRHPVGGPSAQAPAQPVLFWPAVLTGAALLTATVFVAALLVVVMYLLDNSLPARAESALAQMYLWKVDRGAGLVVHTNARIILVNCIAAVFFAQFGSGAALLEGTLRARYPGYDRLERLSGRRLARAATWMFPRLREIPDDIAREAAALALAFPFIAVAANGIAIGVLLGSTALAGGHSLASTVDTLWLHGLFELPALLLAAAVGYAAGLVLLEAGRSGLTPLLAAARARLISRRVWVALAGIFGLLIVAGTVEPTPSPSHGGIDRAALGTIIRTYLR